MPPLDEAIRPGMPRFGASMLDPEGTARLGKPRLPFRPAVGQHGADVMARALEERHDMARKKCSLVRDVTRPTNVATAYEHAASQAVSCQTLPTPLSLPM